MSAGKADASGWAEQKNFRIRFMLLLPPGIRKKLFREQQRAQLGLYHKAPVVNPQQGLVKRNSRRSG